MNRNDFIALLGAGAENTLEGLPLSVKRLEISGTRIPANLPHKARLFEQRFKMCYFIVPPGDKLRVKTEPDSD